MYVSGSLTGMVFTAVMLRRIHWVILLDRIACIAAAAGATSRGMHGRPIVHTIIPTLAAAVLVSALP